MFRYPKWIRLILFTLSYLLLSAYIQRTTLTTVTERIATAVNDLESRIAAENSRRNTAQHTAAQAIRFNADGHNTVAEFRRQMRADSNLNGGHR